MAEVTSSAKPRPLDHICRYVFYKDVADVTDREVMDEMLKHCDQLMNGHLTDVCELFRQQLRMNLQEQDIEARILSCFVSFDRIVEENGLGTRLGAIDSSNASSPHIRMKNRCKLLVENLAPDMLKSWVQRLVDLQHRDAKIDDVLLYNVILERARRQQHYHMMTQEGKQDKRKPSSAPKQPLKVEKSTKENGAAASVRLPRSGC